MYTCEFCKLKVVLLCDTICKTPYGLISPLSSLSQCSTVGLELSCIKPTVCCSQVGRMGDFAYNRVPRVECLCLSLNGLSHLLQRMNMRCLRCQHCKCITVLEAQWRQAVICFRHASISARDDQRAQLCQWASFTNSRCLISFLLKEDMKYVGASCAHCVCAPVHGHELHSVNFLGGPLHSY